jgi:NAD(P)-dependent dehydrogenase (short-subunit alcohol dehydrogenase family)
MNHENWVLITGGAKRIGAYLNEEFAKRGHHIVLHYHQSEEAAIALKLKLSQYNVKVILWCADLNDPNAIEHHFSELLTQVPHIALLINNASVFEQKSLLESSLTHIQRNLNVHLTSPWLLIQGLLKQQQACQVINISDANLAHRYTSKAAYFISKKAQETLTELAAIECAPNVRVNAVAPGFVLEAALSGTIQPQVSQQNLSGKDINVLERKVPLTDLYLAIEFLLNNQSITGQTLQIDGGSHLKCPPYMSKN